MSFSLIIPIASDKKEYEQSMPYVFRLGEDGIMYCIHAIMKLNLHLFDNIYFSILTIHNERYYIKQLLDLQFQRLKLSNAKVVIIEHLTYSQPETIYQTIKQENIKGSIYIKDADCTFSCEIMPENSVAIYPLENLSWVNPQNKSYVAIDDMFYVTNIIEKRIISHFFSAGGYGFENSEEFCKYYELFVDKKGLYLSHIIYAMLLNKHIFRPSLAQNYQDFNIK